MRSYISAPHSLLFLLEAPALIAVKEAADPAIAMEECISHFRLPQNLEGTDGGGMTIG